MNCPDEPDNTCPKIDAVLDLVMAIPNYTERFKVREIMEKIRQANSDLRERANFFEQEAGEHEEARDNAITRAEKAEDICVDLRLSVSALQEKIDKLEASVPTA